ncbi:hypothetical protein A2U01_0016999, partial [Trifolium medium]|nr:hypothetical protein [Trifolium medium]
DPANVMFEDGETSANAMKKSLFNEGLLILKFCPELLTHQSFTNHFKIVEGLCDLHHIIV